MKKNTALKRLIRTLSLALAVSVPALMSGTAHAALFNVYVGYVDNLRASGFFPTIWIGGAGVVSQTPTGESLDAGAIRIDNTSGAPLVISNFTVHLPSGGQTFNFWGTLTIPTGGIGIFTQTVSYNFDTSDFGMFGAFSPNSLAPNNYLGNGNTNLIGGCSSAPSLVTSAGYAAACAASNPIITFLANGSPQSFTDTGQIINTGGWDFVNNGAYGEDGNESINWNAIGSGADRGGTGVPEPAMLTLLGLGLIGTRLMRRRPE